MPFGSRWSSSAMAPEASPPAFGGRRRVAEQARRVPDPSTTIGVPMATDVTYSVEEVRALIPVVRAALLQLAVERRRPEPAVEVMRALVEHLESLGIVVRDLDEGLVDFPTVRGGERAWLCWKMSDGDLGYWHTTREGFASRQPL